MIRYIIRRLLWGVLVLVIVTGLTFLIYYVLPSTDPAVLAAGRQPTPRLIVSLRHLFGTDRPMYVQYGLFMKRLFLGDQYGWPGFGFSFQDLQPIKAELYSRLPVTLSLTIGAAVVWLLMGISIGIVSAIRRGSLADRASMLFALFGVSMPIFWLGLVMLYVFWFKLHIACSSGYVPIFPGPGYSGTYGILPWACHLAMPWFALALAYAALYARMVRGNLLETMNEDYIRTARAKGLSERAVIFKHALRGALTTVVTMVGMDVALLLGGAVIVEVTFGMQGLGYYAFRSVVNGDLPAIQATTLLAAFAIVSANLLVDILYAYLDPRVRYT